MTTMISVDSPDAKGLFHRDNSLRANSHSLQFDRWIKDRDKFPPLLFIRWMSDMWTWAVDFGPLPFELINNRKKMTIQINSQHKIFTWPQSFIYVWQSKWRTVFFVHPFDVGGRQSRRKVQFLSDAPQGRKRVCRRMFQNGPKVEECQPALHHISSDAMMMEYVHWYWPFTTPQPSHCATLQHRDDLFFDVFKARRHF